MDRRRFWRLLLVIAAGALLLRVGYVVVAKSGEEPAGDQIYYHAQAGANAEGRWFRDASDDGHTAEHPPLTALALTPTSWISERVAGSNSVMGLRFTIAMFGVAAVVVIGLVGRRIAGDRVGLIAAGVAAISPNLWVNDGLIMSETLATMSVALAILLAYQLISEPRLVTVIGLGLACGLATLARQELLLLGPIMVVPTTLWIRAIPLRRRLVFICAAGTATLVMIAPWVGWNLARFEKSATFSTNDGITLCGANLRTVYYGSGTGLWSLACAELDVPAGDRSVRSAALRDRGFEFIGDHLGRLPIVVAARIGRVWSLYEPAQMVSYNRGEGREPWVSWLGIIMWWTLVPLAAAGATILRRRRTALWPLTSQLVIVTVTAAAIYGLVRFRVPAEVTVIVLAAVALDAWTQRGRGEPSSTERSAPSAPSASARSSGAR